MKTAVKDLVLAALCVAAFFAVLHASEDEPDHPVAGEVAEAEKQQTRLQRIALEVCMEEVGPGARALWTREGDLVCRPAVIVAGGAE